jgi:hypothetical protein
VETTESRNGEITYRERSIQEFQAVAVDIWGQRTSTEDQEMRPNWQSVADIQHIGDSVLSDGGDVDIFYMTPAKQSVFVSRVTVIRSLHSLTGYNPVNTPRLVHTPTRSGH